MGRKAATETEKATTPLTDEFFANVRLTKMLDDLALAVAEEFPEDGQRIAFRFAAIGQAANLKRAEAWAGDLERDRLLIEEQVRSLAALREESTHA